MRRARHEWRLITGRPEQQCSGRLYFCRRVPEPIAAGGVDRPMQWAATVLVLVCACEDAASHAPAVAPPRKELEPLSLARPDAFHVMLVDDQGAPRCERWSNDPKARQLVAALGPQQRVTLSYVPHEQVEWGFRVPERAEPGTIVVTKIGEAGCFWQLHGRAMGDDLVLDDGARWFRTAAGCAAAIDRGEKVATLLPCTLAKLATPPVAPDVQRASAARFAWMIRRGQPVYLFGESALAGCTQVATRGHRFTLRYELANGERGVVRYGFTWKPGGDTMVVEGPDNTPDDPHVAGYARLCGTTSKLGWLATGVELHEPGTLYFTLDDCTAGLARYDARARWLAGKEPTTSQCGGY